MKSIEVRKEYLFYVLLIIALLILTATVFTVFLKNKAADLLKEERVQLGDKNMVSKIIRYPSVDGSFYPDSKTELKQLVADFFSEATDESQNGVPRILIVPHAGYAYSGQVAAQSFKQLEIPGYTKAILIGPSHHFPLSGLFLSKTTHWQTPLGEIEIDNLGLEKENGFEISEDVHKPEHSLEVEIPFLQYVAPGLIITPIIVGQLDEKQQLDFASTLKKYLDDQTVLIVSVDMSHYHPYDEAVKLDKKTIQDILELNHQEILKDEIDAPWALASVLELARQEGLVPKLLDYKNSGDITGDKSSVVGYSSIVFYDTNQKNMSNQEEYTKEEKTELLKIARDAIISYLEDDKVYEPKTNNPKFMENRGVFVTLNKNGKLRGCIGYIQPIKPLAEAVSDNAISAAVEDNRFLPLDKSELEEIEIEISVLTVPKDDTIEEIIKYKKGVVLSKGNRGATYLPQVWEGLSDPDQFFQSLCLKGGLSSNCYKDTDTQIMSYEAVVFGE
jgi:hypothetical protein